jgi:hypothetical protein
MTVLLPSPEGTAAGLDWAAGAGRNISLTERSRPGLFGGVASADVTASADGHPVGNDELAEAPRKIYMYPGVSESDMGFASSLRRAAVVCGDSVGGMSESSDCVWEDEEFGVP